MNLAEALAFLQSAGEQVSHRELGPLTVEAELQALGLDSVQLLEMITVAEQSTGLRLPDEAFGRVRTVGDLCEVLMAAAPDRQAGAR
ncbi:acyl carrier protein [Streptomyces scopuliridis]|uniref:Acyl carrier protein n=1 Tax=Streptomyces scopuliridis TaxID=452529 RepID=A0ACD4ZW36_9ACTN|nr:acyl carrier protein [Streptomyces scopuliridis]WSC02700.1 acyl carrier protein [Streptomyces scopuliridis]WSC03768.1 acyl carrier protein [Streptomyces scopuliridis]